MATTDQPLLEMCSLCETLQPSSEISTIYIRNAKGVPQPVRMCRRCMNPRITYIAGHLGLTRVDVPRVLGFTFGLTIAVLNVVLGRLAGGTVGLFIALAGILAGAGISVAFAVSLAMPHGGET